MSFRIMPLTMAALLAFAISLSDTAAAATRTVRGTFSSTTVTGPTCSSPVGLCTAGALIGYLSGSFEFTATSLVPIADTPTTGVVLYTGDLTLHTKDGQLTCKDAGAFQTIGPGSVSSVCAIVAGWGSLAGATGTIQFVGTFTLAGGGEGDYVATISMP